MTFAESLQDLKDNAYNKNTIRMIDLFEDHMVNNRQGMVSNMLNLIAKQPDVDENTIYEMKAWMRGGKRRRNSKRKSKRKSKGKSRIHKRKRRRSSAKKH